jgi:hypothetical protein
MRREDWRIVAHIISLIQSLRHRRLRYFVTRASSPCKR